MRVVEGITVFEFTALDAAQAYSERCIKPMQILLGDCPYYWVASLGDAERLVALGYEFVNPLPQARSHVEILR